jgi:catalase (peroxidase I)
VRLGFHDAASWNRNATHGGADGSLILAPETSRTENNGLQTIVAYIQTVYDKYKSYGIGMADLIQVSANVATVVCPLGPRVRTYVGRKDSSTPAPDG